ncbi:MAG: hypothetical protein ACW967_03205 [Candidatus Hodarchaeales archaeon]
MDFIADIFENEFNLLFLITIVFFAGFFLYLTYIYKKTKDLKAELKSLQKLDEET